MPQLTLDLDEETSRAIDAAAGRARKSRAAWVREALRSKAFEATAGQRRFNDEWFANLGTWEDDRTIEDQIAAIRGNLPSDSPRAQLD